MREVLVKGLAGNGDEGTIKCWYFEEGDRVTKGDDLLELVTADESVVIIPVPVNGILAEVYFGEGETVQRDEVICTIDDESKELRDEDEDDPDDEEDETDGRDGDDEESEEDY
ncbi:MAG TPA: hypothetical protein PK997_05230 [Candidatus Omnitrophota bacterium]|jgi:pyruvate/2-oxoglutarate dehydrogenase complex dihydrolipoamide acyltransferase (E2) component|nr:MAG: branched-chain alpha-keto acid dehydrogenase subunit E2 [Candidatus Omnitrophica bacterium ADurb.Bin314]HOE69047.1 hypothetical protein [Candidatus Omnitrophota bacterium]HPW64594.1 hypothetical protein [Candidatus Omnitrophota bacterium]HQB94598.1 hypothetical protein [Candidatus Omnitrophota bacterium]